ncbi:MAG: dynamin family protein [bacterium]
MNSTLESNVLQYQAWRDRLVGAIETFRARLDTTKAVNVEQSLRMYDLIESLRTDRMLLAFIAEYSRGKTELINALFFSNYKRRLLPSDIGRTTMCPTEIFYDPAEEPYLRLLPIETRETDESVAAMKRNPIEWIRISLPLDDADELAATLAKVVESKRVTIEHARRLGLYNDASPALSAALGVGPGEVLVPAWRHALINFPHPMLKAGLAILDTPGLNALGTEPELTLSMIPNAHAVLFLLAMDTGVTRSDLELWQRHVQNNSFRSVEVL